MGLPCDPMPGGLSQPCRSRIMAATCMAHVFADLALAGHEAVLPLHEAIDVADAHRPRPAARAAVHLGGRVLRGAGGTGPQGRVPALVRREPPGGQASGQPDLTHTRRARGERQLDRGPAVRRGQLPRPRRGPEGDGGARLRQRLQHAGHAPRQAHSQHHPARHGQADRRLPRRGAAGRRQGLLARELADGPLLPGAHPPRPGPRAARRDAVQRARALRRRPRRRGRGDEPGDRRGGRGARRDRVRGASARCSPSTRRWPATTSSSTPPATSPTSTRSTGASARTSRAP